MKKLNYIKMIWSSKEWYLGDKGTLSYPEIIDEICKNNPKHSDKLRYILDNKNNDYILFEATYAYNYLLDLKNKGYKLYFLSNVNKFDLKYDKEHFKIFELIQEPYLFCRSTGYAKPEKNVIKYYLINISLIQQNVFL